MFYYLRKVQKRAAKNLIPRATAHPAVLKLTKQLPDSNMVANQIATTSTCLKPKCFTEKVPGIHLKNLSILFWKKQNLFVVEIRLK